MNENENLDSSSSKDVMVLDKIQKNVSCIEGYLMSFFNVSTIVQ